MSLLATPERTWPRFITGVSRDRLQSFRLLFLAFALITLVGATTVLGALTPRPAGDHVATGIAVAALGALWIVGYRRRGFSRVGLVLEAALLVVIIRGLHGAPAACFIAYLAIQFRALYGAL